MFSSRPKKKKISLSVDFRRDRAPRRLEESTPDIGLIRLREALGQTRPAQRCRADADPFADKRPGTSQHFHEQLAVAECMYHGSMVQTPPFHHLLPVVPVPGPARDGRIASRGARRDGDWRRRASTSWMASVRRGPWKCLHGG